MQDLINGMGNIMAGPQKTGFSRQEFDDLSDDDYEKHLFKQGMEGNMDFDTMPDYEQQRLIEYMTKKDKKQAPLKGEAQAMSLGMSEKDPKNVIGLQGLMGMASKGGGVQPKHKFGLMN